MTAMATAQVHILMGWTLNDWIRAHEVYRKKHRRSCKTATLFDANDVQCLWRTKFAHEPSSPVVRSMLAANMEALDVCWALRLFNMAAQTIPTYFPTAKKTDDRNQQD